MSLIVIETLTCLCLLFPFDRICNVLIIECLYLCHSHSTWLVTHKFTWWVQAAKSWWYFQEKRLKRHTQWMNEEFLHINMVPMNVVCVKGHPGTSENVFPLTMIPYTQITFNSLATNVPSFIKFKQRANVLPRIPPGSHPVWQKWAFSASVPNWSLSTSSWNWFENTTYLHYRSLLTYTGTLEYEICKVLDIK